MAEKGMFMLLFALLLNMNQAQENLQQVNSDLTQIKAEMAQMNGVLTEAMNQVYAAKEKNKLLKSKISDMQTELSNSQRNQSELQRNNSLTEAAMQMKITTLENRLSGVGSVVFMLQFKDIVVKPVSDNAVLKYDDVFLNVGGGYDRNTGIFTCPKAGLYMVSVRCASDVYTAGKSHIRGTVYRNNDTLLECAVDDEHGEMDFVQIYANLNADDQLLVKQTYSNANEFFGGIATFFSGVLLVPKI